MKCAFQLLKKKIHDQIINDVDNSKFSYQWKQTYQIHQEVYALLKEKSAIENDQGEGYQLYKFYVDQLKWYLEKFITTNSQNLDSFVESYSNFVAYQKYLAHMFQRLDQDYVQIKNVNNIRTMSLHVLYERVFKKQTTSLYPQFIKCLSDYLMCTSPPDYSIQILNSFCRIIVDMGGLEDDDQNKNVIEQFRSIILASVTEQYKQQYQNWINNIKNPTDFLIELKNFQTRQQEITTKIFEKTDGEILKEIKEKIIQLGKIIIIQQYKNLLIDPSTQDGLFQMLQNTDYKNLSLVYDIYKEMDDKFTLISKAFKDFISEKGRKIFDCKVKQVLCNNQLSIERNDSFIMEICQLYQTYSQIMHVSFKDCPDLKQAMNNGFEVFINQKIGDFEMYEYLAFYTNKLFISSVNNQVDLCNIQQIYSFLNQKELFIKVYQHLLAKRLLTHNFNDHQSEKTMLNKIKELSGHQSTKNLDEMIEEYRKPDLINQEFKTNIKCSFDVDIKILQKQTWPEFQDTIHPSLNSQIDGYKNEIENLYTTNPINAHKQLHWISYLSQFVLAFRGQDQTYQVQVSYYQTKILLLYQFSNSPIQSKEIQTQTELPDSAFKDNIEALIKAKLIVYDALNNQYNFNEQFIGNQIFIRVQFLYDDKPLGKKSLENEREGALEASIIKIMKVKKVLPYHELIKEVQQILKTFNPLVEQIKNRIERLIDREYLQRDQDRYEMIKYS